ncbi:unnamed protein product [Didymodactylos carnosus]|uniref:Sulfatase N-terminal domain-containing protein n=1 Tax=Didymodactylos carnosus TaxID=1234261 RepID=A0A815BT01_9BILA|nr:unnamed protein product [Didymodactylos carnosus]CAF4064193.1 unnamed protein product [Didymodactylos carnosus]
MYFDCVSASNFRRKLPLTMKYLSELYDRQNDENDSPNYCVSEFIRYHIGGMNTRPNLQLLLCGDNEKSNELACAPHKFLPNIYRQAGYITNFINNDCCDYPSAYLINTENFRYDHELTGWSCHPDYDNYGQWSNTIGPYSMNKRCINGKFVHSYVFDYLYSFIDLYSTQKLNLPHLTFASFTEGHEGTLEVLSSVDEELSKFLKYMTQRDPSNSPWIYIISDHGSHMGPHYEFTTAGQIEHKLPVLYMLTPKSVLQTISTSSRSISNMLDYLKSNSNVLITSKDVYHTLRIFAETVSEFDIEQSITTAATYETLYNNLSLSRNCKDLGILNKYCACINNNS